MNPLTPEVVAAMERIRQFYLGPWPQEYINPGGTMLHRQDQDQCLRSMLSLFPPGMPAPTTFTAVYDTVQLEWLSSPDAATAAGLDADLTAYRMLAIPIERLEPTP